jgi:ribosome-binding ATPase YchF (GTP1/OBG family)
MKLGLYGRTGSGRQTIFEALGQGLKFEEEQAKARKAGRMAVVQVPDQRLAPLAAMFKPKKVTPAKLTFLLPDETAGATQYLAELATTDGLLFILGSFQAQPDQPAKDLQALEEELILRDLAVAEGVLERLSKGKAKGQTVAPEDLARLSEIADLLNAGRPIRVRPDLAEAPAFRSYAFLSAKPRLVVLNVAEGGEAPLPGEPTTGESLLTIQEAGRGGPASAGGGNPPLPGESTTGENILVLQGDRKSTRLNSSHRLTSRMPSSA